MPTAAYTKQRNAIARRAQILVEIDEDRCTRTYGVAPCTAADLGDGSRCRYTFTTCQDPANYDRGVRTLRFCLNDVAEQAVSLGALPYLIEALYYPQRVDPDQLVTDPESIVLRFHLDRLPPPADHDKGAGKFNTARIGEFWRNFKARTPNYPGRKVRILEGFFAPGHTISDFVQQGPEYVMKQILTNGSECRITIESPLVKLKDKEVCWATSESNVLQQEVPDAVTTTWYVLDALEYPDPTGFTRNNVYAKCEDEIVRITARDAVLNTLTVVRGQAGTTAVAHAVEKKVSNIAIIGTDKGSAAPTGKTVADAMLDVLEWVGVSPADIDTASFDALTAQFWATPEILFQLTRPRRAADMLAKIREPRGILLYISADGKWTAKVMAPGINLPVLYDRDFCAPGLELHEDDESRITRASIWYAPERQDASTLDEYTKALVYIDANLESANYYGDSKEQSITDAGLSPGLLTVRAVNLARRLITRKRAGIRTFTGRLELKNATLQVGDGVLIVSETVLTPSGNPMPRPCIVTARQRKTRGKVEYEFTDVNYGGRYLRIGPNTLPDTYDEMTDDQRQQYGAWGDEHNRVGSQKEPGYTVW